MNRSIVEAQSCTQYGFTQTIKGAFALPDVGISERIPETDMKPLHTRKFYEFFEQRMRERAEAIAHSRSMQTLVAMLSIAMLGAVILHAIL